MIHTPIQKLEFPNDRNVRLYCKREDLLPFSLGGNKVVLVGSLIQDQMTRGSNWPFAAALAVVMMVLTTVLIMIYRKVTNARELEGIG